MASNREQNYILVFMKTSLSNQDLKVFNLWLTKAHAYLIEKDEINGGKSREKPQKLEPMEE